MKSINKKRARLSWRCLAIPVAATLGLALMLPGQAFAQSCNGGIDSNVISGSGGFLGDTVELKLGCWRRVNPGWNCY